MKRTIEQLKRHEGFSPTPYYNSAKELCIGYNHKLDNKGITEEEAEIFLANDLISLQQKIKQTYLVKHCNSPRLAALVHFSYYIGISGLGNFKQMLHAIEVGEFGCDLEEILHSHWARKSPSRAIELVMQLETGHWQ